VKKVLYVEDNQANVDLMREVLAVEPGIVFYAAGNAIEAIKIANRVKPDLVFMDIKLGGPDGYELLQMMRDEPDIHDVPVIAVTAAALPSDIKKGTEAGFDGYITKPYDLADILSTVKSCDG